MNRQRESTPSLLLHTILEERKKKQLRDQTSEQPQNHSEETGSEVLEGSKSHMLDVQFEGIKALKNTIFWQNGKVMDSEFPKISGESATSFA